MSRHSTAAIRSTFSSIRSARRRRRSARPETPSAAQAGKAAAAASTASPTSRSPPARDLGEHLLVDRGVVVEAVVARNALPADEVVGRDRDSGDDGTAHGREHGRARVDDGVAAVDGDDGAGHESRLVGRKPGDGCGDLLGDAGSSQRHRGGDEPVGSLAVGATELGERVHGAVGHRRPHPARADAVRAHPERPVIDSDALGQHDQAGLRGAVGRRGRTGAQPRV